MIEDLFNEEVLKPKKKKTVKPATIIMVLLILLMILCVSVIVVIVYLNGKILKVNLDGAEAKQLESLFIIEENNKVYMPIRRMAEYLKYDSYNGDYITRSEDPTKCYAENIEELVSFTLNSNVLTKIVDGQSQQIKITEPIKEINGELCITSEGAQDAFNFKFYYDVNKNNINIETLTYLYTGYSQYYQTRGYLPIEEESFANKTAILDNLLIVKSENNYFGVININTGGMVLETKYDSIEYLRNTSDFLVGSNNKKGIISIDQETKVELIYDSIQRVTNKNDIFYVIGKSNLYGLLDVEGKTIIYPEYEQIGMDVSAYEQNGVTNGYIFYNKLIPVRRNNKWGLFDIEGSKVVDFIYDSFGCPKSKTNTSITYGVIQALDYNLIIGCQGEKYNLITLDGKGSNFILDDVYIEVSKGNSTYYVTTGGQRKELMSFLQENGLTKAVAEE